MDKMAIIVRNVTKKFGNVTVLDNVSLQVKKGTICGIVGRKRLGIAQAIMENQSILILDEPMNGLDNKGVDEIRKLILDLKKEGRSIILASHNREDIQILCDQVYEMDNGKIIG